MNLIARYLDKKSPYKNEEKTSTITIVNIQFESREGCFLFTHPQPGISKPWFYFVIL